VIDALIIFELPPRRRAYERHSGVLLTTCKELEVIRQISVRRKGRHRGEMFFVHSTSLSIHTPYVTVCAGRTSCMAALQRLALVPVRHPLAFGVGISAAKTSLGDYIAQIHLEKKQHLDLRRSAVFFAWGAFYLGGVQYFVYSVLFPRVLFPSAASFVAKPVSQRLADRAGQLVVLKQVVLDQFVHHPFMLFPCFYVVKEFIEVGAMKAGTMQDALGKYRANIWEDCKVCWSTWVPAFLFNFSVCPLWGRVPFVATVSMGFTVYFSYLRGGRQALPIEPHPDCIHEKG
jgi:hypothetical protein